MAVKQKNIIPEQFIPTSVTALYTVPSNVDAQVIKCTLTNSSAGAVVVNLYVVRSGQTPVAMNNKVMNLRMASGQIYEAGAVRGLLDTGDALYALADTASAVNITADANIIT